MNSPNATMQTMIENLNAANRKFLEGMLGSLAAEQNLESEKIFKALMEGLVQDGKQWANIQQRYCGLQFELWNNMMQTAVGAEPAALVAPDENDRRFEAPEWRQLPYFAYLKQAYLLNSRWLSEIVEAARLDAPTKNKLRHFTRQMIDAAAPTNFAATNPEVLRLATETNGESLRRGLEQLNADLIKGRISMTDESAFEIGRNIAATPGTVVYENELMQLIQYLPSTDTVFEQPLLMVPPCINKYYILDLQPKNSLVRHAVAQGHTVFMVSWRNMPEDMGHVTWDQYLELGVIRAIEVAREICGVEKISALGFCIGGTMLASALAVLRAQGRAPVANLTLLAAMLDFSDTGELSIFVDEAFVAQRERDFAHGGVLRGGQLAATFSSLRANDLIWNYVVNNYLKGRKPDAFDLLYWNSDGTNLPGAMYVYYLRNTYLENNLRVPAKLSMCGVPVDLGKINLPSYVLASRDDHIVPWKTAFQSTQLLGGEIEFVLAASGHIAGVINPPAANKRNFWAGSALPASADQWLEQAQRLPGSWWSHWSTWLAQRGGNRVPARTMPGNAQYPGIEPAPGRYVKQRCD